MRSARLDRPALALVRSNAPLMKLLAEAVAQPLEHLCPCARAEQLADGLCSTCHREQRRAA